MLDEGDNRLQALAGRLDDLAQAMERASLAEYVELVRQPWRMARINFIAGVARGLGSAVGFTILGAFLIYLLQHVFIRNLPVVGSKIAALVDVVQMYMRTTR